MLGLASRRWYSAQWLLGLVDESVPRGRDADGAPGPFQLADADSDGDKIENVANEKCPRSDGEIT